MGIDAEDCVEHGSTRSPNSVPPSNLPSCLPPVRVRAFAFLRPATPPHAEHTLASHNWIC